MNKSVVKPTHKAGIPGHPSPARLRGQETPAFAKPEIGTPSKGDAPYSAYTTSAICSSAMTVIAPMVRM
ncbi:hypothetical protein [Shinella sp.]|uniref:hypothetical protein n=1 Tax=Shinella sp. TaxID=1870904 RepID=UPI002583BC98|nr:hypothetical protein [Shinella sp.]MCW5712686.1 hypothetical protein [Shinella sp.]